MIPLDFINISYSKYGKQIFDELTSDLMWIPLSAGVAISEIDG